MATRGCAATGRQEHLVPPQHSCRSACGCPAPPSGRPRPAVPRASLSPGRLGLGVGVRVAEPRYLQRLSSRGSSVCRLPTAWTHPELFLNPVPYRLRRRVSGIPNDHKSAGHAPFNQVSSWQRHDYRAIASRWVWAWDNQLAQAVLVPSRQPLVDDAPGMTVLWAAWPVRMRLSASPKATSKTR